MPQHEAVPAKILPGNLPKFEIMTPAWFIKFSWKYVFLNNSGAFKDFRKVFFMETLGWMFESS